MFCRISFLIDRNDWRLKLVEVLVGFKEGTMLTHYWFYFSGCDVRNHSRYIFQFNFRIATSSSWLLGYGNTSRYNIQGSLASAFSMCWTYFTLVAYTFLVTQKSIIRATAAAIEFLLTFIRFIMSYRTQRVFGGGIRDGISNMQTSTRLSYAFYRDGILLAMAWVQTYILSTELMAYLIQSLG